MVALDFYFVVSVGIHEPHVHSVECLQELGMCLTLQSLPMVGAFDSSQEFGACSFSLLPTSKNPSSILIYSYSVFEHPIASRGVNDFQRFFQRHFVDAYCVSSEFIGHKDVEVSQIEELLKIYELII